MLMGGGIDRAPDEASEREGYRNMMGSSRARDSMGGPAARGQRGLEK